MEFGDRARFGASLELDEHSGGEWMFGKFCYWIDGKMVGNYEEGTSLRDVLFAMKWMLHDSENREDCTKFWKPALDVFESIFSGTQDDLSRFNVVPFVDIFFNSKVYLINCGSQARLLYKDLSESDVSECFLTKSEFDECIRLVWDELNILYDRERSARPSST